MLFALVLETSHCVCVSMGVYLCHHRYLSKAITAVNPECIPWWCEGGNSNCAGHTDEPSF